MAEVLVTLGIIGVVAAMTMPSLIAEHQKNQTAVQLKKAYTEIYQAVKLSEEEYGTLDSWDFEDFPSPLERIKYFGENYFYKHLNVVKKCIPSSTECWAEKPVSLDGLSFRGGGYIDGNDASNISFITNSGYSVNYWVHGVGNGGWFYVDINGPNRGKNMVGKDIFPFLFSWGNSPYRLGFYPLGLNYVDLPSREDLFNGNTSQLPEFLCKKGTGKTSAGGYCGAVLMIDDWKVKNDYPW